MAALVSPHPVREIQSYMTDPGFLAEVTKISADALHILSGL